MLHIVVGWLPPTFDSTTILLKDSCELNNTFIGIRNNHCQRIRIFSIESLDTVHFKLGYIKYPIILEGKQRITIPVTLRKIAQGRTDVSLKVYCGPNAARLLLYPSPYYHIIAQTVLSPIAFDASARAQFGAVNLCGSRSHTGFFSNRSCDSVWITALSIKGLNGSAFQLTDNRTLPIGLAPGQIDSFHILFTPERTGLNASILTMTLAEYGESIDTTIPLTGTGTSIANASLSADNIHFDSIQHCEERTASVTIHTGPCDSLRLDEARLPSGVDFQVLSPAVGTWIGPDDSIKLIVHYKPKTIGLATDEVLLDLRTRGGAEKGLTLNLDGYSYAPKKLALFQPDGLVIDAIPPCRAMDTTIELENLGVCDTLILSGLQLKYQGSDTSTKLLVTMDHALPDTLLPGERVVAHLHIEPGTGTSDTASILWQGQGLDTTTTATLRYLAKQAGSLEVNWQDTTLATTLCQPDSIHYTVWNKGCGPAKIDSIALSGASGSAGLFELEERLDNPFVLPADSVLSFTVLYQPSDTGSAKATLTLRSSSTNTTRAISLTSSSAGSGKTAQLSLAVAPNDQTSEIQAGATTSVSIISNTSVPLPFMPSEIHAWLHFNSDLLTLRNSFSSTNWDLGSSVPASNMLELVLKRKSPVSFRIGDTLVWMHFEGFITDSISTAITLDSVHFNESDPSFEHCILSPDVVHEPSVTGILAACGTDLLRDAIRRNTILGNVTVRPNPSGSDQANLIVMFTLHQKDPVTMELRDALGRLIRTAELTDPLIGSTNIATLPTSGITNGVYLLTVTASGQRISENVVIAR